MKNNKGSISVIFVIVLSLIIGSVGLAVDYGYAVIKDSFEAFPLYSLEFSYIFLQMRD